MTFVSNTDWTERRRVILEVQAAGGTASEAAKRLGMKTDSMRRAARKMGLPFPACSSHGPTDWEGRRKVILAVQASGGTAKDAAERLGLQTDTVLKTARKLGIRFPSNNGYHDNHKRRAPTANAGTVAVRKQNQSAWTGYHARRRFALALEKAPEQTLSDVELIERAIAEGKVTRIPAGSGLGPMWLAGFTDNCVKPRAGASRGRRA